MRNLCPQLRVADAEKSEESLNAQQDSDKVPADTAKASDRAQAEGGLQPGEIGWEGHRIKYCIRVLGATQTHNLNLSARWRLKVQRGKDDGLELWPQPGIMLKGLSSAQCARNLAQIAAHQSDVVVEAATTEVAEILRSVGVDLTVVDLESARVARDAENVAQKAEAARDRASARAQKEAAKSRAEEERRRAASDALAASVERTERSATLPDGTHVSLVPLDELKRVRASLSKSKDERVGERDTTDLIAEYAAEISEREEFKRRTGIDSMYALGLLETDGLNTLKVSPVALKPGETAYLATPARLAQLSRRRGPEAARAGGRSHGGVEREQGAPGARPLSRGIVDELRKDRDKNESEVEMVCWTRAKLPRPGPVDRLPQGPRRVP